jgi:hypothetical protein
VLDARRPFPEFGYGGRRAVHSGIPVIAVQKESDSNGPVGRICS